MAARYTPTLFPTTIALGEIIISHEYAKRCQRLAELKRTFFTDGTASDFKKMAISYDDAMRIFRNWDSADPTLRALHEQKFRDLIALTYDTNSVSGRSEAGPHSEIFQWLMRPKSQATLLNPSISFADRFSALTLQLRSYIEHKNGQVAGETLCWANCCNMNWGAPDDSRAPTLNAQETNFSGAAFCGASLYKPNFTKACLCSTNWHKTETSENATVTFGNFEEAQLNRAFLGCFLFFGCGMQKTDLSAAIYDPDALTRFCKGNNEDCSLWGAIIGHTPSGPATITAADQIHYLSEAIGDDARSLTSEEVENVYEIAHPMAGSCLIS